MKVLNYLSVAFLVMTIVWSCDQSNSKKQENKIPQEEQRQMPEQSGQKSDPFQQPTQENNVSDEELKAFAAASRQVQTIDNEARQKISDMLRKKGLDLQRFQELQQDQTSATNEEKEKYKVASKELERIREQANQKIKKELNETGLTLSRYEEIGSLLRSDPNLQERFKMIQSVK